MEIPLAGQMYEHPSRDVNFQRCVNMFPTSGGGREEAPKAVLLPTPGLKELIDTSGQQVRALIKNKGLLYAVVDNIFYEITINTTTLTATKTNRGTLNTSVGAISWEVNPTQIMLVDGANGYIYTPADTTLTTITDASFTGGTMVAFMDSFFVVNVPDSGVLKAASVNDGITYSALDTVTAEGRPDKLVGIITDKRELWAFGEESVEIYYNPGTEDNFPFCRRQGAFLDIGCAAAESITIFNNTLMWLDNRGYVVMTQGYTPQVVSTEAIHKEIDSYESISDAYAFQQQHNGHLWYVITFPTAKKTWVYDAFTGMWHERAYFTANNEFEHHLARCAIKFGRLNLVGDRNSGRICIMSSDYYDDAGEAIHRIRTTPHQTLELNQIGADSLELHMESGKGLVTGQGSNPKIMMRYSQDGGYTWSHELTREIGKLGEYDKRVRWNRLGSGREWIFEFRITDPISFALITAYATISGGR